MYNEGYVDAAFLIDYLNWLREKHYTDRERPLHMVIDNARYQHCALVKQSAEGLNIVLEFLPPYSPNLNLIERLWKSIVCSGFRQRVCRGSRVYATWV